MIDASCIRVHQHGANGDKKGALLHGSFARRPAFSAFLYRYRNLVERFFGKLKRFRAVSTRCDKRDGKFLATIQLASIRIWLRHNGAVG